MLEHAFPICMTLDFVIFSPLPALDYICVETTLFDDLLHAAPFHPWDAIAFHFQSSLVAQMSSGSIDVRMKLLCQNAHSCALSASSKNQESDSFSLHPLLISVSLPSEVPLLLSISFGLSSCLGTKRAGETRYNNQSTIKLYHLHSTCWKNHIFSVTMTEVEFSPLTILSFF